MYAKIKSIQLQCLTHWRHFRFSARFKQQSCHLESFNFLARANNWFSMKKFPPSVLLPARCHISNIPVLPKVDTNILKSNISDT